MTFGQGQPEMATPPSSLFVTRHARRRSQQRAIRGTALHLTYRFADIELPAGDGCTRRMLSHRAALELLAEGWSPALVGRATRLTLVVADDETIVTAWPRRSDARRAHPRRPRDREAGR